MIPLKLQIKNFLSYGPELQTIDFSSYPLICLSGKNGHGKSALLDAITWSIWGQARKISNTSKADHGLLHLGQSTMMVLFDFECNGQLFRVKREYAYLYGKPYTSLEFGIIENDTVIPLTDKTIRATQHKIEQTLHIDFDSFVNSAFLRQGQSNEFSKKSPKERKDILACILGLNQYELIRKLALEKSRDLTAQKTVIQTLQDKYAQELEQSNHINNQLTLVDEKLGRLKEEEQVLAQGQKKIEQEKILLLSDQKKLDALLINKEYAINKQKELQHKLLDIRLQWRSINKKQRNTVAYEQLEQQQKKLSALVTQHQQEIQRLLNVKEEFLHQKNQLNHIEQKARSEYAIELQKKQFSIDRLNEQKTNTLKTLQDYSARIEQFHKKKSDLEEKKKALEKTALHVKSKLENQEIIEKQFEKRKEHYHTFIAMGNALKTELNELEQKQQLVHDDQDPSCPLCEQNLSATRKRFLKNKFVEKEQFLNHRLARITRVIKTLKELLIKQHAHIEEIKKYKEQQTMLAATLDEHNKTGQAVEQELEVITNEQQILQIALEQITQSIKKEETDFKKYIFDESAFQKNEAYKVLSEQVVAKQTELITLSAHQEEQQKTLNNLKIVEQEISIYHDLKNQIALQQQRMEEICAVIQQLRLLKKDLKQIAQQEEQYKTIETRTIEINEREQQQQNTISALQKQKEALLQEKGNLESQKNKMNQVQKEYDAHQKQLKHLSQTIDDFAIIAQTTGKDGIQALLIEDAIPEIEHEANSLLAKLTNNQAQMYIESLRDLKKGGTKETLDIKISDAIGIRPYELFSGGEAFRIDFALRIAISKLLARRAGTSLQTLIIDEGFGSQDEEGLAHIMDVIYKIQEDFAKIIIVSHLPSMKDQFPAHFVIEKGPQGSMVKVIEQG